MLPAIIKPANGTGVPEVSGCHKPFTKVHFNPASMK